MIRRLFALCVAMATLSTMASTGPQVGGFCCHMDYSVTNRTSKLAQVTASRRSNLEHGQLIKYGPVWILPGKTAKIHLREDDVHYDLVAIFRAAGEGSKTIGRAEITWYLRKGSADHLAEDNGRFEWAPGR